MNNREDLDYEREMGMFGGNKEYKVKYLYKTIESGYSKSSSMAMVFIFKNAKQFEDDLGKDLYDFTQDELEMFLKSLAIPNINSLQSSKATLDKYLLNSVSEDKMSIFSVSPTLSIKRNKLKDLIFKDALYQRLCTEKELYTGIRRITNYIDKALLIMIFRGMYNTEFQMIRDLRSEDINFEENYLCVIEKRMEDLVDESTGEVTKIEKSILRRFEFNDLDMNIIKSAFNEEFYTNENKLGEIEEYPYHVNEHFFKVYNYAKAFGNSDHMKIRIQTLRDKIRTIQKESALPFIKAKSIALSGDIIRFLEIEGIFKEYSQNDCYIYRNENNLKYSYLNFYNNLVVMQDKYREELQEEELKLEIGY